MKKVFAIFCIAAFIVSITGLCINVEKQKMQIEKIEKSIAENKTAIDEINSRIAIIEMNLYILQFDINEIAYSIASEKTGSPVWILRGIQFAESSYGVNCNHPDPFDTGDFGINERPDRRAERVKKWGDYNAMNKVESATIAGFIIMENYSIMGDMDKAISAYRRGRTGTNRNGIDWQYVEKVKEGGII